MAANERQHMMLEVLTPLADGSKLKSVCLTVGQPKSPHILHRSAHTGRRVCALLDFMKRSHLPGFGRLLVRECLEAALSVLVVIIDNPLFVLFVGSEASFANACHCLSSIERCGGIRCGVSSGTDCCKSARRPVCCGCEPLRIQRGCSGSRGC